jgi:hypothetical protein
MGPTPLVHALDQHAMNQASVFLADQLADR